METNIIFGAPGTGKTTKLLSILEELLKTYSPEEIAYVSFTKEGAYQGKKRAMQKFGYKEEDFPYFATLHSLAFRALKLSRNDVMQKKHYKIFSEKMGMNFIGYYTEEFYNNDDKYLFFNDVHRNNVKCAKNYINNLDLKLANYVSKNFKNFKNVCNILDFTDMIERFNTRNMAIPVKIAIIDEAQDLTTLQWQMVWTAFKNCDKIYIAGDDDQAIYQWSGADVDYFLSLRGNIEILKHSYRLPKRILYLSKNIAHRIDNRVEKDITGIDKQGDIDYIANLNEIQINNNETYMFLARNNYYLGELEKFIQNKGLLYYKKYEKSAIKKELDQIKFFEEKRKTRMISQYEEQKLKQFTIKNMSLDNPWYDNFNWGDDKINYWRDLIAHKNFNFNDIKIKVSTIHTVKGGEADNVVIVTDITKNVKENLHKNPDSEHRVFYVGCTRAKNKLYILQSRGKNEYKIL